MGFIRKDQKAKFHDQILNIPVLWSTGWLDNGIGLRLFSASLDSWLNSSSLRIVLAITGELEGFFCKVFVSSNGIEIYWKLISGIWWSTDFKFVDLLFNKYLYQSIPSDEESLELTEWIGCCCSFGATGRCFLAGFQ